MTNGVWQLYLFCALELFGFLMSSTLIPFIPDHCKSGYGGGKTCTSTEMVLSNYNSIWLLSLAVYFFVLTFRNRESGEKLKRLAYFAIYCSVSNLTALLLIGSTSAAGMMKTGMHVTYVLLTFLLFFILVYVVNTDSPMVAHTPIKDGLGLNVKGYILAITLLSIIWIFINSDFQSIGSVFLNPDEMTKLARLGWNWWSVLVLQNAFVLMFTLSYGDDGDQETVTIASIFLWIIGALVVWALREFENPGIVRVSWIQASIFTVLALLAVIRHRMQGRQNYEPVSSNV
jgi:hypothetical protein